MYIEQPTNLEGLLRGIFRLPFLQCPYSWVADSCIIPTYIKQPTQGWIFLTLLTFQRFIFKRFPGSKKSKPQRRTQLVVGPTNRVSLKCGASPKTSASWRDFCCPSWWYPQKTQWYCWWFQKSQGQPPGMWDKLVEVGGWNPISYYISGGCLGFLPSTVRTYKRNIWNTAHMSSRR